MELIFGRTKLWAVWIRIILLLYDAAEQTLVSEENDYLQNSGRPVGPEERGDGSCI